MGLSHFTNQSFFRKASIPSTHRAPRWRLGSRPPARPSRSAAPGVWYGDRAFFLPFPVVFPQNIGRLSTKKTAKGQSVTPMTPIMSTQCTHGQCKPKNYWSFKHEQSANMLQTCTCCAYMLNMLNLFKRFTVYANIGTVPWSSMFPLPNQRNYRRDPRHCARGARCAHSGAQRVCSGTSPSKN